MDRPMAPRRAAGAHWGSPAATPSPSRRSDLQTKTEGARLILTAKGMKASATIGDLVVCCRWRSASASRHGSEMTARCAETDTTRTRPCREAPDKPGYTLGRRNIPTNRPFVRSIRFLAHRELRPLPKADEMRGRSGTAPCRIRTIQSPPRWDGWGCMDELDRDSIARFGAVQANCRMTG